MLPGRRARVVALLLVSSARALRPGPQAGEGVLILGAGWVGSRLGVRLFDDGEKVLVTNRPRTVVSRKDPYFRPVDLPPEVDRRAFDVNDRSTWGALPPPEGLDAAVLTFSTAPEQCTPFWDEYLSRVPRVVCYSSTAVYRVDKPDQLVTEATALRPTPRALAEAYMQERGATVLTISGIFGEPRGSRGVCNCLSAYTSSGGTLNGRKSINMVHVDDIIDATCALLGEQPFDGERINVAGLNFQLRDLISHCQHPPVPDSAELDTSSKIVSNKILLERVLPPGYHFSDWAGTGRGVREPLVPDSALESMEYRRDDDEPLVK